MSARSVLADAARRWNKPRPYRARTGIGRGLKQIGGIGLILPAALQRPPEYPELEGLEEAFLRGLDWTGKTIYDIGAFEGIFSMFFARQVGPGGHVVAFEPLPRSHARILEHLELNAITNVTVCNVGLGRAPGELRLHTGVDGGRATADARLRQRLAASGVDVEIVSVPITTVDAAIAERGLPDPDFVKIDVEGLEIDVLEGMRATLERCTPDVFVEIHGADWDAKLENARGVIALLTEAGYPLRHVEHDRPIDASSADEAVRGHLYAHRP